MTDLIFEGANAYKLVLEDFGRIHLLKNVMILGAASGQVPFVNICKKRGYSRDD